MPEVVHRQQYHDCAAVLDALPGVRDAVVIEDDARLDRPCIELVIGPDYVRVPPRVHGVIRDYDFGTRPDLGGKQGQPGHFVVVVC